MIATALTLGRHGVAAPHVRIDERRPLLGLVGSILWRFDGRRLTIAWLDASIPLRERDRTYAGRGRLVRRIVEDEAPRNTAADTAARFLARRARGGRR